jgi:tRNA/tmRNA/rRNA uracil-C5-methylase (TrmA/RlmC/RlmD family)
VSGDPSISADSQSAEVRDAAPELRVGDEVELEILSVAHGGSCVARHFGRVVFVRYALPGEMVRARIVSATPGSFARADAVEVLRASPGRVEAPCAHFGPGGCGGCDFQHADAAVQRALKAAVVEEQLRRLGKIERRVEVEQLAGPTFGWRTRVRWGVAGPPAGSVGPRRYHSHEIVPLSKERPCLIAASGTTEAALSRPLDPGEVVLARREDGAILLSSRRHRERLT